MPDEIAQTIATKEFVGRQIFKWIHQKGCTSFAEMTDVSKELRQKLEENYRPTSLATSKMLHSKKSPGTKKALLRLADGETVESVLIREGSRYTLCLSSQVGCAVRCSFCATGLGGFKRNLDPGEIAEQAYAMLREEQLDGRTPNIVYMGMGEPFRNYDSVLKSIRLLRSRLGQGIGARKITVSTSGEVKGIERFTEDGGQVRLSVSLHAADDELRSELVPLNRKYPLRVLIESVEKYQNETGRHVTFEWTLISGVNDTAEQAAKLTSLIRPLQATVNLIPWNPVPTQEGMLPSSKDRIRYFADLLISRGVNITLRTERGGDIQGACGQLRGE